MSGPARPPASTGIAGLDELAGDIRAGDNIVWRVDHIDDYAWVVAAAVAAARAVGLPVLSIRFSRHDPLVSTDDGRVIPMPVDEGFEAFIVAVHAEVVAAGPDALIIFDSLSDLSGRYYSDRMIGNFFQLTCPLVLAVGSVAYFSLDRHFHSYHAVHPVAETAQILIDLYSRNARRYLQLGRAAAAPDGALSTLYEILADAPPAGGAGLRPVSGSAEIVGIVNARPWPGLRSASYRMVGVWDRLFLDAETRAREVAAGLVPQAVADEERLKLIRLIISRDRQIVDLAVRHLSLDDLIAIWKRMIGTGMIGGKAVGMLIAQAVMHAHPEMAGMLEGHDSFFVGSDVYYTYLVANGVWWDRQRQKDPERFLEPRAGDKIRSGSFPSYIVDRLRDMLEYFGRSPIIVRSSSLLEDNFGNAFAGKYESVFCTNQGSLAQRLDALLEAIRTVYASSVSEEALRYRKSRGLLEQDEQMALLIQRVSGAPHGSQWYFPHLAGVAFSYNPFAWHPDIDPNAGVVRLVFGLGTRAVDRADDDYTRVVALNAPEKRPEADFAEIRRHAQRRVDALDLGRGDLRGVQFVDLLADRAPLPLRLVATRDRELARSASVDERLAWILTFDRLLSDSPFVPAMRTILDTLRAAYATEVDVEFAATIDDDGGVRLNIVQCRPLQVQGLEIRPVPLPELRPEQIILRSTDGVVGHSRVMVIDHLVMVVPEAYAALSERERVVCASILGRVVHHASVKAGNTMLVGPGRWGTSTPSLGIPVRYQDIEGVAVLAEIDELHSGLVADLSLGTHFFNELVEMNLLYIALRVGSPGSIVTRDCCADWSNLIADIIPDEPRWHAVVRVVGPPPGERLELNANSHEQVAVLYRVGDRARPAR